MDRIDAAILRHLQDDGRISWARLADKVNLSASACQRRVDALQARGVIENFTVNLNEKALGHGVKAFVSVNVDRSDTDAARIFRRRIREHPQVQSCYMISGTIDFILEVVADNLEAFGRFVDGELLNMPVVKDASSTLVLDVVKPSRTMI